MAIGNFDTGGSLDIYVTQRFFSAQARKDGWLYFFLEPGIYYIGFQGGRRTDAYTYNKRWEIVPKYRFEIESNTQVAYIGTMQLKCESAWFFSGQKWCNWIFGQHVKNEEILAKKLGSKHLPALMPCSTTLMQLHTGKTMYFQVPKSKE
jgi:hypothetical protein